MRSAQGDEGSERSFYIHYANYRRKRKTRFVKRVGVMVGRKGKIILGDGRGRKENKRFVMVGDKLGS